MKALGIDYGTTNSLITEFCPEMASCEVVRVYEPSAIIDENRVVERSPKRRLNQLDPDGDEKKIVLGYISRCIIDLITNLKRRGLDDKAELTLALTVPNAFKDTQCALLKEAVKKAFLVEFKREFEFHLIPEPVAAALYYAYCKKKYSRSELEGEVYIVVSDIGGGTTDLAVVKLESSDGAFYFDVVCTEQDSQLGGDDIDKAIASYLKRKNDLNHIAADDLLNASRFIKEQLSYVTEVRQHILLSNNESNNEYYTDCNGNEIEVLLSRGELESLLKEEFVPEYDHLLQRLVKSFKTELSKKKYNERAINDILQNKVVLLPVGGSSRIPMIQNTLRSSFHFNTEFFTLNTENDFDMSDSVKFDSVSRGAAIYAAFMAKAGLLDDLCNEIIIENRTMHRYSVRYAREKIFILVDKTTADGDHVRHLEPKEFPPGDEFFSMNILDIYQGGRSESKIDKDSLKIKTIPATDLIRTNGRNWNEIDIVLTVHTQDGRIDFIKVFVADGCGIGKDYEKLYRIEE